MTDDRVEPRSIGNRHGLQSFGDGADLIQFDQNRIGSFGLDAHHQALGLGDEQVVTDALDAMAVILGEVGP